MGWGYKLCPVCFKVHKDGQDKCVLAIEIRDDPPPNQRCENCRYFEDFRKPTDTPREANGYCGHPDHSKRDSPHRDYGGHWTRTDLWCARWTDST